MTTYMPAPSAISLFERLVGAEVVVWGRIQCPIEQWADPAGQGRQWFGLLEVEVNQALRGKVPEQILVRIAGQAGEEGVKWGIPVDEGEDVLFLLAEDEDEDSDDDRPRYGLQHSSAFRLREGTLEIPKDVPLGTYADEPGQLPLETVKRMLSDIEASATEHRENIEEVGRGASDYPAVDEAPGALADQAPPYPTGAREGRPGYGGGRPPGRSSTTT